MAKAVASKSVYFSRAVAKALELLDVLGNADDPASLHQLATRIKLTKSSAFRLLFTLEATGYVEKDADGFYALRYEVRGSLREKLVAQLVEIATPVMRELTREFGETTGLAALFDNHIEVVAVVESSQIMRMGNTVGRILQPHASSLGKSICAFQSESRREHLLRSYGIIALTPHTLMDERDIHLELERTRQRGYATDREETCADGYCFGVPLLASQGEAFAALSMSMPKSRLLPQSGQERLIKRLKQAAVQIANRSLNAAAR